MVSKKFLSVHFAPLIAVLSIIVIMTAVPTASGQVTWSDEAVLYRDVVLPCVIGPIPSQDFHDPVCLVLTAAENIALETDMVVDVTDLRASQVAYLYNCGLFGDNLTEICEHLYEFETPCLGETGISPIDSAALVTWITDNNDAINIAVQSACVDCDFYWNPDRPIIPEFPTFLIVLLLMTATAVMVIIKKKRN